MSIHTISKPTGQLAQGDIIWTHGMRLLIDQPVEVSIHHHLNASETPAAGLVRFTNAQILNPDEAIAAGIVPASWIAEGRWTIQGNDWATWAVELHQCCSYSQADRAWGCELPDPCDPDS